MENILKKHQIKFAKGYKNKDLLVHEGGTGKTICACVWLKDNRDYDALVICPKKVVRKWEAELNKWQTKAQVVSKEEFKKLKLAKYSAIVVDEADEFASPLFVAKKRSQLSTTLYEQVKAFPSTPILLLTATPIRSTPWNLHTLLVYLGIYIDWKEWRDIFFNLERKPYLVRPAYIPKPTWRQDIRYYLEKYSDIVLLKDCVDDLPPVTEIEIKVETPKYVKKLEDKVFFDEHRWEQQNKAKEIIEIGKNFRKVLVVAYYREQVEQLQKELSKNRETFVIYGGIKDQEKVIEDATKSDECFFITQASSNAGYDGNSFSCIVFASMSYAVRDWIQTKFRARRIHDLHPVKIIYLLAGRCDRAVWNNVKKGKNFSPSEWIAN